jgi:acyl-CoA dehydrogenase
MAIWILAALLVSVGLIYFDLAGFYWVLALIIWIEIGYFSSTISFAVSFLLILLLVIPGALLALSALRRSLVTPSILALFKRILPTMSNTERDALEAGSVWWDAELFSGRPNWDKLLSFPAPVLTSVEQSFLSNEVHDLCDMVKDWDTTQVWQDLPPDAWQFIKDKGFLGMIIPKKYGGKEFSAYMHSQVIMKLSSHCSALAVSVMVPNSLGPAELLLHYGTEEQKKYYLPRLASGLEIPCFALTNPFAGSDAAAIPDVGVICRAEFEGQMTLGLRVTWSKRYITLAPIATLLGLAFRTIDRDHLLGKETNLGITCALVPTSHSGVVIGRRHWPLNAVFQNGPTSGVEVFIPMEWVIGGLPQLGKGWRMLMECLAAGRAISLPSSTVGMAKLAVRGTSAYAAVRRQFNTAIGQFEGVQEAMARMGGNLYMMDAARQLSVVALDLGEKPAVISAIVKYHVTERGRMVVNDGMDILGGKGICMGRNNFLARAYQQLPIAITVEGANILTRCLIIFGQGAIRSHPYVLKEMHATTELNHKKSLCDFDQAFFSHIRFFLGNLMHSLAGSWTGSYFSSVPDKAAPELHRYYRALNQLSCAFALLTDLSMFILGSSLKRRESISGRLGDILSQMFLISSVLKRFENDGRPVADAPYVHWSVQDALQKAHLALQGVLDNFPNRILAFLLRVIIFPFGAKHDAPLDALSSQVANAMQSAGENRDRLLAGTFIPGDFGEIISSCEMALRLLPKFKTIELRLKEAIHDGRLKAIPQNLTDMHDWLVHATFSEFISSEERRLMLDYTRLVNIVIQVNDFPKDFCELINAERQHGLESNLIAL